MPQVIPAITAALTPYVGGTVAGYAAQFIYYVGSTVIASTLTSLLQPSQNKTGAGQLVNSRSAIATQDYVYGRVRKGGTIVYMASSGTNNKYLHVVIALAGHPVESVGDIYINDEIVSMSGDYVSDARWGNKIRIKKYDGTQTAADPDLIAETEFGANSIGTNIPYLYVRMEYDQDVFSGGIPTFTAVVTGKQIQDTNGNTLSYPQSANAALVIRDYLSSSLGLGDTSLDDTYFATAASDCDDDIPLSTGGTQKRYTIDGVVDSGKDIEENLRLMIAACNGTLYYSAGQWRLRVGVYEPSVASFTLADLRSEITLPTRLSRRDNFNLVVGTFIDADGDWIEADYPPVEAPGFLAEDGNLENQVDLPLPYVTNGARAQRVAKQTLFRSREQMTFSAEFSLAALNVTVGDIIDLTISEYGWTAKEFEVVSWRMTISPEDGARIVMTLRETSEAAFDWNAEESQIIRNNTTLLPYYEAPDVSLTLTASAVVLSEKLVNRLNILVESSQPEYITSCEVEFKEATDTEWTKIGTGQLGKYFVFDLERAEYDVRARSVNPWGVRGDWTESSLLVDATAAAPSAVGGLNFEVVGRQLNLSWDPIPELDLSYYRIRYSSQEGLDEGASWAAATTAVDKVARPGVSASLPVRPGTYHVRAFDKGGVASPSYTSIVVPSEYVAHYNPASPTTDTQVEHTAFSGTKTGTSVASSKLRLTSPVSANDEGTYEFSAYIDTGSARLVWSRIEAVVERLNDSGALFDELPGLLDSMTGLWDDLTSQDFADHNVQFFISTTTDDPAGSPTWSSYQQFRAGNFYGRAFRFMVKLTTQTDDITPGISELTAIVEY